MSTKSPRSAAGRPSRKQGGSAYEGQPWSARRLIATVGAAAVVIVVAAISWTFIAADNPAVSEAPAECGWDLSTSAGQDANAAYLSEAAQWIADRGPFSTETPPAPTSEYWLGECASKPVPPPIDEAHPHEH